MKKYLVVGNPIEHSLSPKLQNYWLNSNNIEAIYGKLQAYDNDLKELCNNIKNGQLSCEVFRVSETTGFVISCFKNKSDATKIMKIMASELNEVKGNTKIKLIEGERVFKIER